MLKPQKTNYQTSSHNMEVHKIKLSNFTSEISGVLDPDKRTLITVECDIRSVERPVPNGEEREIIYKAKVNGSTVIQQAGLKEKIIGKSKRTQSQKLKQAFWKINPEETYYDLMMDKIVYNLEDILQFLKDK